MRELLAINGIKEKIAEHPFLKGFNAKHIDILARHAREVEFREGQLLFHENEAAYAFFLLLDGRVALESHVPRSGDIPVQVIVGGDVLGWSWLFPPFTWHFQARALAPTRAIFLDGASLLVACENDADFGYELVQRMAQVVMTRLQATRRYLLEFKEADRLQPRENPLRIRPKTATGRSASLRERLAAHPFFRGLKAEWLDLLAENAMPKEFEKDESIFEEGSTGNRFYLIEQGEVALGTSGMDGKPVAIEMIAGGDVLGWSWLFPPYYWHFGARAREKTTCIFIYGTRLREQCEADHALGYELMKRFCQVLIERLQATRKQLLTVRRGQECEPASGCQK